LHAIQKSTRTIIIVILAQYVAIALGMCWGYLYVLHSCWITPGFFTGATSCLGFGLDGFRFLVSTRSTPARWRKSYVCIVMFLYCGFVMWKDPFLDDIDDRTFIDSMLLLMPFFLAMSSFARSAAWLAILSSVLFVATSIAMLIHNAGCRGGVTGFFIAIVY
jgi:hypothetical protein